MRNEEQVDENESTMVMPSQVFVKREPKLNSTHYTEEINSETFVQHQNHQE